MQFCLQLYIDIWKIIPDLQANTSRLKTKNLNSVIFKITIIKYIMVNDFLCFRPAHLRAKSKVLAVY